MDTSAQLRALIDLAESLNITIRRAPSIGDSAEQADRSGGTLVRLKGKEILFLDVNAAPADQIAVVARALRGREALQERFVPPEIRDLIDRADDD